MAKKCINARCPLSQECERKACEFVSHELDCIYYSTNGWGENSIPDQEEIREQRHRADQRLADEEAMDALVEEETEELLVSLREETDGGSETVKHGMAPVIHLHDAAKDRTIETITEEILDLKQVAGEAIMEIGRKLIEAKRMLSHGEWLPWLNEQVEFSERSAQNFINIAENWSNPQALADLGKQKALSLLSIPAEEREEFMAQTHVIDGQEKTVYDMTTRQLKQAIRERDEARMAAETARANADVAEASRAKMEEDMASANVMLEAAHEEHHRQAGEIARLEKELYELRNAPVEVAVMAADEQALAAARAEGAAEVQAKLEKAKGDKKKAEDKLKQERADGEQRRKQLEEELSRARQQLAELEQAEKKAAAPFDDELAQYKVRFAQVQETINQMHGQLLKARARDDQSVAQGMQKSMLALAEQIRRCAE